MILTVLNPRNKMEEKVILPFATMADIPSLTEYYRSRGLVLVEARTEFLSL